MEILFILGLVAAVALPLHLLNRRDADVRELDAALRSDPRLRIELMCARDYQQARAEAAVAPVKTVRPQRAAEQRKAA